MKAIKFRGEKLHKGDWAYGYYLPWHSVKDMTGKDVYAQIFEEEDEKHPKGWAKVIASTIGQFTGLYDKNGKEIYEGDIVKAVSLKRVMYKHWGVSDNFINTMPEHEFYQIKYNEGKFQLFKGDNFSGAVLNWGQNGESETLEVIGNIYDNPELIKE